jgi:hypothetical protein
MPQKDTLDNLRTPVCFRILSSSLTSVSIFSLSCYSIVSISVIYSPERRQGSNKSSDPCLSCVIKLTTVFCAHSSYFRIFFPISEVLCTFSARSSVPATGFARSSQLSSSRPEMEFVKVHFHWGFWA